MEIKIESTIENKLLDRKELEVFVHFDGATPARSEIKSAISGKIGANPDFVVLRDVANEFGLKRVKVSVHVYENADKLKTNEPKYIQKREGIEKPAEEAKPETPKEEKPAEAPKEEKKAPKEEKPKETKKETENPKPETDKEEPLKQVSKSESKAVDAPKE
jgi:small subunit ribosomal protein S24e